MSGAPARAVAGFRFTLRSMAAWGLPLGLGVHVRVEQRLVQQRLFVREQVERVVLVLDLWLNIRVVFLIRQWLRQHERVEFQRRGDGDVLDLTGDGRRFNASGSA